MSAMLQAVLSQLRPTLAAADAVRPVQAVDGRVVHWEERCHWEAHPDGDSTAILRCQQRRRVLQGGVEVEVSETTSSQPGAASALHGAVGAPPRAASPRRPGSPTAPLDAYSHQMLEELFDYAAQLELGLRSRGALGGGSSSRGSSSSSSSPVQDSSGSSNAGAAGAGAAPAAPAAAGAQAQTCADAAPSGSDSAAHGSAGGSAATWAAWRPWGWRAAQHQQHPVSEEQARQPQQQPQQPQQPLPQQQQQQQQQQQPTTAPLSLGALARAQGADTQAVL